MSTPSSQPEKTTLTDQLRARTTSIIDPVVTLLAKIGVSPDLLTILGMLLHFFFAWLIATGEFVWAGFAIFIFVPLDALDGALARKIGRQQGNFGAFLDSTSDRIAEIILYSGYLSYFYQINDVWMSIATYAAVTGSIMVSYTRSRAEALGLSCKVGLLTRVERYVVIVATLVLSVFWPGFVNIGIAVLAVGTWFTVGQRVYHVWRQTKTFSSVKSE